MEWVVRSVWRRAITLSWCLRFFSQLNKMTNYSDISRISSVSESNHVHVISIDWATLNIESVIACWWFGNNLTNIRQLAVRLPTPHRLWKSRKPTIPMAVGSISLTQMTCILWEIVTNWSLWFSRMWESVFRVWRSCLFGWRKQYLEIPATISPRLALAEPLCGVPKKMMPRVFTYISAMSRCQLWFLYAAALTSASFTTRPPRLWAANTIGRV